ncbi:MAG: hypothetical protein AAGG48_08630 [Planctomycetota bacterium]
MSTAAELIDRGRFEIKLGEYGVGPATALSDPTILSRTQDYRRLTGSRMVPLGKSDIRRKVPNASYHVSRKVDGEFTVLVVREGNVFSINPGGTVRVGLPWQAEAATAFKKAGVEEAMVAGELYAHHSERRPRVHDVVRVARQPSSDEDLERLRFAAFDLISIDGRPAAENYADTWQSIESIFGGGQRIHPVETRLLADTAGIEQLFSTWVEGEDAEGVVVRSDGAGLFKVKPRHNLDVVIIGFTESSDERHGMLHDLLVAVMRQDGTMHVLCRVGGGFSEDERRTLLSDLKDRVVASEYAEVNSDYVAYQMVRPETVIEISCLDLIAQTTRGGTINRMVLEYDDAKGFQVVRRLPLVSVISPQFIRMRSDKQPHPDDVRMAQITQQVEVSQADTDAKNLKLPKTELLKREVFAKELKGETMVRKFVILKTNKEDESDEYPAYVVHYTDFSPNRKEPLSRDVLVSSSKEQIEELYNLCKEKNIKKGWRQVLGNATSTDKLEVPASKELGSSPDKEATTKKKATKKKATKKTVAKKTTTKKKATKKKAATKTPRTPK